MKLLKIILFCACSVAINNIAATGFAINSNENYQNFGSLHSNYGQQTRNVNGVSNKGIFVPVPVDQNANADRDKTNEEEPESITHPSGHKTKRCKSLTSLRKARLSAVNNDESKLQSGNFVNKNQVAYPSSNFNNNKEPTSFSQYINGPRLGDEKQTSFILKNSIGHKNTRSNEPHEILLLERQDDGISAKKKKYICYCVDDDCMNEQYKEEPASFYHPSDENFMSSRQFYKNDDLYSQLSGHMLDNSGNNSPLGVTQQSSNFPKSNLRGGKKNPQGKRLKSKKITPFIVPCNLNDNPTKFSLPLDLEQPSTSINPYYNTAHNNYGSVNENSNDYYQSPYIAYPHQLLAQPQLDQSTHEIAYDNLHINPQPESISSALDECINLYGRDYCLSLSYYQHEQNAPIATNSPWNYNYQSSTESSSYNGNAQFDHQLPGTCYQNILAAPSAGDSLQNYNNANSNYESPLFDNNKYTGYDGYTAGYDNYLEDQMNTGIVDSSTEYIIKDAEINGAENPHTNNYSSQQQEIMLEPNQIEPSEEKVASILDSSIADDQDYVSTESNEIVGNNNDYADISTTEPTSIVASNLLKAPPDTSTIVQPGYHYHSTESQSANVKVPSSSDILPNGVSDEEQDFLQQNIENAMSQEVVSVNYDENMLNSSSESPSSNSESNAQPDYETLGNEYMDTLSSEEESINDQAPAVSEQNVGAIESPEEDQLTSVPLDTNLANPIECSATSTDSHLENLKLLTGLSIEDTKLLRAIIYDTVNKLASNRLEPIQPCTMTLLAAPAPATNPMLGDAEIVKNLFNIPAVRNLAIGTIKTKIPQVTATSANSNLDKLTDNVIGTSLSIVLGSDEPIEPELGLSNESNLGASIPETIASIINSIISRPGIGLSGVRLPGIQNIIVRTIENIFARAENIVDSSTIWETLNNLINQRDGPKVPVVPSIDVTTNGIIDTKPASDVTPHGIIDTKPLPYIPVTEHYIKDGMWQEGPATIGYKGEFPEARTPITPLGMNENLGDHSENDYSSVEEPSINTPIKYHSPEDIVLEYIKNHSADESSPANENPSTIHHLEAEEPITEENYNDSDEQLSSMATEEQENAEKSQTVRIPALANIHEVTTERYHKSYTKTRKYYTINGKKVPIDGLAEDQGNCLASKNGNPTYFGKIISDTDSSNSIGDLEGSNLYYIGDGVKLPLTIKRLDDGSFALSLSDIICQNFVKENCPCCVPKLGNISQEPANSEETTGSNSEEVRSSRHTHKKSHSRRIRSTTSNGEETIGNNPDIESNKNISTVTVMPVERFAEKYNLTLNLPINNNHEMANAIAREHENEGVRIMNGNNEKSIENVEKNQYIEDLLSIQDVGENDRAALVINALDGLLNSSIYDSSPQPSIIEMKTDNGFDYQIDNPIMQRIKYIKEKQLEHGKYRYQQNFDHAARIRMEVAKNLLHWLRELLIKSKANAIS